MLYHLLHLSPRTKQQLNLHLFDLSTVCHHCLPSIFISTEGNERISLLSPDNMNTALRNGETSEVLSDVQSIGRPRQILKSYDDTHL